MNELMWCATLLSTGKKASHKTMKVFTWKKSATNIWKWRCSTQTFTYFCQMLIVGIIEYNELTGRNEYRHDLRLV